MQDLVIAFPSLPFPPPHFSSSVPHHWDLITIFFPLKKLPTLFGEERRRRGRRERGSEKRGLISLRLRIGKGGVKKGEKKQGAFPP